jgi:carbamoyltransferase
VHKDIAAALQDTLEKIVFHILEHYRNLTKHTQLCLAGGVALNCTLNGKITTSGLFKDVYVFPGANDSGLPIGSALAAHFKFSKNPRRIPVKSLYLGTALGDKDVIAGELKRWEPMISWTPIKNIPLKAAQLLAAGKVLGWVQGRSEFAARALGNRSIIADPRPAANKERINYMIKKREGFRPFAPSVLAEYAREYFEIIADTALFANMNFAIGVRPAYRACLAAVTHVDGTARLQCVSRKDNDKYWRLINYFREITGIPVLLNTSFNNNVEPIVDTVRDAVVCFLTTRLDFLIIDDFLISKDEVTYLNIKRLYASIAKYTVLKKTETRGSRSEFKPVIKFEIGNTYNEITEEVDEEVFDLLASVDGTSTLEDIMDGHKIEDTEREERLMKSVTRLWEKRMIMLEPEANGCR